jgi:ATP synthase F0 subunit c
MELKYIGIGLAIGLAAIGAGLGIGRIVAQAMESTGRNPEVHGKLFTMMILGVAFTEALAIFALVLSFMMISK